MADKISPERRSANMARIRGRDTAPELLVRRSLHAMGMRFRLQRRDLPGKPDIVLPRHRVALFVHGCFWHQHQDCSAGRLPKSNQEFWAKKLSGNASRDERVVAELNNLGWRVIIVWECELECLEALNTRLAREIPAPVTDGPLQS
jgi:DNA mismatch endonuclease (patch repair protein)